MTSSLHNDITEKYFETTASRSHSVSLDYYCRAAKALERRMWGWLPSDNTAVCVDLACGSGELLFLLERQGFAHIIGIDLCETGLEKARKAVSCELVRSDIVEYLSTVPADSVDLVTALNILEHLPKDSLKAVLDEARRVLRPGGTLVAMVPNAISPFGSLTRHWDITHEWAFTPNNFRQLAALTGFSPHVEFRECGPVPYSIKSAVRYALWQALRLGIAARMLIEVADTKDGIYTMDMLVRLHAPSKTAEENSECQSSS